MKFKLVEDINKSGSMLDIAKKLNIKETPLTEAKADTQKLIDFAGEDLAKRFLAIRQRLKSPENDLYYWIKNKSPQELAQAVSNVENTKSKSQQKKEVDSGAKLICDTEHWKVYEITTFEASQKYGRDSKWCITGVNNYGDKYWNDYTNRGIKFYFLITKGEYDARGKDSKFAIALYPDENGFCEVYNQQDARCWLSDIPHYDEIQIPGVELFDDDDDTGVCDECGCLVDLSGFGGNAWGPSGELLCLDCFDELCTYCYQCDSTVYKEDATYVPSIEDYVCEHCLSNKYAFCDACGEYYPKDEVHTEDNKVLCDNCIAELADVAESVSHKMKFTLVEEFEELDEDVNSSGYKIGINTKKACWNILKSYFLQPNNTRGAAQTREVLISKYNDKYGTSLNPDDYVLHHRNGLHSINDFKNVTLIRKSVINHTSFHSDIIKALIFKYADSKGYTTGATIPPHLFSGMTMFDQYRLLNMYLQMCELKTDRKKNSGSIDVIYASEL